MKKRRVTRKKVAITGVIIILALACIAVGLVLLNKRAAAPTAPATSAQKPATSPTPTPAPAQFDKTQYSTTDASSIWVVVNKQHPLTPLDYAPSDLITLYGHQVSAKMSTDLQNMVNAAASANAFLTIASSYRSYSYQVGLYNKYVASDGQAAADTYSARPGYSEHQTGLAIDFGDRSGKCTVEDCYGTTPEGEWLAANAWQYGFILRYTTADQPITGYENEPWHYRYVGQSLSREMHKDSVTTLEQFFGITGGESYADGSTGTSQE